MLGRRFASWVLLVVVASFLLLASCGRSGLDELFFADGGVFPDVTQPDVVQPDAGACSARTCPTGCCDANGRCRAGTDATACGTGGVACNDCPSRGFDFCDSRSRACARNAPVCNSSTCADGCCTRGASGDLECQQGISHAACGKSGAACSDCASSGQVCNQQTRACEQSSCASRCPNGCCLGDQCLPGVDGTACGAKGQQCVNCTALGQTCSPTPPSGGQCAGNPSCGPQNCAGCCRGSNCIDPPTNQACGTGGSQCQNCNGNETCQSGRCQPAPCNASTCPFGCCQNGVCLPGNTNTACGTGGAQCQACLCNPTTQQCVQACNAQTCPNGCCDGNTCVTPPTASQCGRGGAQCVDCTQSNQACGANGTCQAPCGPSNCAGCCDNGNTCQPGFLTRQCGSGGAACIDCQLQGGCNTAANPRVCINQSGTCPAPYPSTCPGGTPATTPPSDVQVCSTIELANARSACSLGPGSAGCAAFFQFEQQQNAACASCLSQFRFDYTQSEFKGIFKCVAPFVSSSCNQATGCVTACQDTSCAQCSSAATTEQCRREVMRTQPPPPGQCASYLLGAACVQAALFGAGSFCNPASYPQGNFGAWLQGVGSRYCGP